MVKDINPFDDSSDPADLMGNSDPSDLMNIDGELYFDANDDDHGVELWKSDGTAAG